MWKPTNQPGGPATTPEPQRTAASPISTPEPTPAAAPRNATVNSQDQATIGKSLVIKGEVTGSESLYIDGRVEGSINLAGNRVTVGRNGVVAANINAREIVVLGKVRGNGTVGEDLARRYPGDELEHGRAVGLGRHRRRQAGAGACRRRGPARHSATDHTSAPARAMTTAAA